MYWLLLENCVRSISTSTKTDQLVNALLQLLHATQSSHRFTNLCSTHDWLHGWAACFWLATWSVACLWLATWSATCLWLATWGAACLWLATWGAPCPGRSSCLWLARAETCADSARSGPMGVQQPCSGIDVTTWFLFLQNMKHGCTDTQQQRDSKDKSIGINRKINKDI